MTMPSIDARKRRSHRADGKFAPRPTAYVQYLSDDAWPDSAMQEAARMQRVMSTDMPPMASGKPIERQDWGPVVNWRSLAIGLIAIAVCVLVYVAFPA